MSSTHVTVQSTATGNSEDPGVFVRTILAEQPSQRLPMTVLGAEIRRRFLNGQSWKSRYENSPVCPLKHFLLARPHEFQLQPIDRDATLVILVTSTPLSATPPLTLPQNAI